MICPIISDRKTVIYSIHPVVSASSDHFNPCMFIIYNYHLWDISAWSCNQISNKPEAVISRTNLAKSPDYSYYNILGQLCKHVLSQFVKGITEYSLTNFRSGTLNLSKLACYFSYIPACVVVAMQRHQIICYDFTYSQ